MTASRQRHSNRNSRPRVAFAAPRHINPPFVHCCRHPPPPHETLCHAHHTGSLLSSAPVRPTLTDVTSNNTGRFANISARYATIHLGPRTTRGLTAFAGPQGEQVQGAWPHYSRCVLDRCICGPHVRSCCSPEEFVAAGEFLTYKFPVWSW